MMRRGISRAERRASRKQISQTAPGIFQLIRLFNRFELIFSLLALGLSVALLFIGTYVYFDSSIQQQSDASEAATTGLTEFYDSILRFYGINTTDFTMLFPVMGDNSLSAQNKHHQIEISMMFVAAISILIEVGLICSIIFEHFRLSLLYNVIMVAGLIYGLSGEKAPGSQLASITFQVLFLATFVFFALGIKVKSFAANRILKHNDIELSNDCKL